MPIEADPAHYGLRLLGLLKEQGLYGMLFTYEQYQALRAASTRQDVQRLLQSTDYYEAHVFADPELTCHDILLLAQRGTSAPRLGDNPWLFPLHWLWWHAQSIRIEKIRRTMRQGARCYCCGYDLRGSTSPRCAECGRPFNSEGAR